jgi:hypothetical protein
MNSLRSPASSSTEPATASALVHVGGWAGIIGPVLFGSVVLLQLVWRHAELDPISEPVSGLGAGASGWIQSVNFAVFGLLTLAFATGLHRAMAPSRLGVLGPFLLQLTGVGLLWAAIFPLERDEAGALFDPGLHWFGGTLYFAVATLAVIALIPRMHKDRRWRGLVPYTVVVSALLVASVPVMVGLTIPEGAPLHDYAGLNQVFLLLFVRFPWQLTIAARMLRAGDRAAHLDGGMAATSLEP